MRMSNMKINPYCMTSWKVQTRIVFITIALSRFPAIHIPYSISNGMNSELVSSQGTNVPYYILTWYAWYMYDLHCTHNDCSAICARVLKIAHSCSPSDHPHTHRNRRQRNIFIHSFELHLEYGWFACSIHDLFVPMYIRCRASATICLFHICSPPFHFVPHANCAAYVIVQYMHVCTNVISCRDAGWRMHGSPAPLLPTSLPLYIYLCIAYSMLFINCSCWCHSPFWQPMPSAFCRMLQKAAEYINVTPLRIRAKRQLLLFDCISYPPSMYLLVDESFSMAALYNRCMPG